MTPSDRSPTGDDIFSSLLESLAAPGDHEVETGASQSVGRPTSTSLDEIDGALFPATIIDLSDAADEGPTPTDVAQLTTDAPDSPADARPAVDAAALSLLFAGGDDDPPDAARPVPLVAPSYEPIVPWWENRRIQAAIGLGAVLVLVLGGLFVATRDTDSGADDDVATDTLPEVGGRNDAAAITTSTAAAGPAPTGLPIAPDASTATTKKPGTTATTKKPTTATTKAPAGGGGSGSGGGGVTPPSTDAPPTTEDTTPTTDPPPVDADVQWGRDMAAKTAFSWAGIWQIGNSPPPSPNATMVATFDEGAKLLDVMIRVNGSPEYDLHFVVSAVPGAPPVETPGTNYGTLSATLDANRNVTLIGSQIPGQAVNHVEITGPLTPNQVRLAVHGDADGFDPIDFGIYDFI